MTLKTTAFLTAVLMLCFAMTLSNDAYAQEQMSADGEDKKYFHLMPMARYALETKQFRNYADYGVALVSKQGEYDDTIKHPNTPEAGLPIDCKETKRIGLMFYMSRKAVEVDKPAADLPAIPIEFKPKDRAYSNQHIFARWSHSDVELKGGKYFNAIDRKYGLSTASIVVPRKARRNGTLTLEMVFKEETVYTTHFVLENCES